MHEPLIRCKNLVVGYDGTAILPPIDLTLGKGEFWAIVGRNGSGKSTWFKTLLGLTPPISGSIEVIATEADISYVPQRSGFDDLWPVRARDVVALGVERGWSFLRPGSRPRVSDAITAVGADEFAHRPFRELSGGQQQRVLIARAIASGAELAFLDEPTASMDQIAEAEALHVLDDVRRRFGTTMVVISHDLDVARKIATRVLFVDRSAQAVCVGSANEVFAHPAFQARYGLAIEDHDD